MKKIMELVVAIIAIIVFAAVAVGIFINMVINTEATGVQMVGQVIGCALLEIMLINIIMGIISAMKVRKNF